MRPDLLILGFDTSAAHCAAALLSGGRVLAAVEEPMATGQAERLMPMLEGMLAAQGLGWRDLSRIGVGTGPGNFTGVRIAVAAARGLALGLGVPAVGVGRLEALALGLGRVTVVEDARRGEAWVQDFPGGAARVLPLAEVRAARVVGSAAAAVPGAEVLAPAMPLAEAVARIAAARAPGPRPAPVYLRAADALPPTDPPPLILP